MLELARAFFAVLEEGSLNRAASRLHISQPSLTRQMQALEHELGGRLLERQTSGVKPTALGHEAAAALRPVVAAADEAIARLRRIARGEKSELRIGYLGSAAECYLTPALAALRAQLPGVKVRLLDLSPGEQITALRKGELDLAMIGQEGAPLAADFHTRKLSRLGVCVALPAGHILASRSKVALAELKDEAFLGAPDTDVPGRNQWITQLCRKAGFRPHFIGDASSIGEGFALVASEGAVTLLPDYFPPGSRPGVQILKISDAWAVWDFLLLRQRGKASPAVGAMVEMLSTVAAELEAKAAESTKANMLIETKKPKRSNKQRN